MKEHVMDLANYAITASMAKRKYPEPPHPYRDAFQRDRDRVLHCSAFRRLDYKTQVFVPHEVDHFRTRLTHSLEVSQVGRVLARALGLNEDLAETIALAHDLGHPPFGHVGESVLNALMAEHGGFDHNRHTLRIVEFMEHPYPDFRGLNVTNMTLRCLAGKHATNNLPLEGQLIDLADEIAYSTADLEDALAAGWIDENALADQPLWHRAWNTVCQAYPSARPIHKRIRTTKQVMAELTDDLLRHSREQLRTHAIQSPQEAWQHKKRCISLSPTLQQELLAMKQFLKSNVYKHPANIQQDAQAETMLRTLFEQFTSNPALLPKRYRSRIGQPGYQGETQTLQRVTCDYLAGMTDRFCRSQFEKLQQTS